MNVFGTKKGVRKKKRKEVQTPALQRVSPEPRALLAGTGLVVALLGILWLLSASTVQWDAIQSGTTAEPNAMTPYAAMAQPPGQIPREDVIAATKQQPAVQSEAQPEVQLEEQPKIQPEVQSEAQLEAHPEVQSGVQSGVQSEPILLDPVTLAGYCPPTHGALRYGYGFGYDFLREDYRFHDALCYDAKEGAVFACLDGVVISVQMDAPWQIAIQTGGTRLWYAGLASCACTQGDRVFAGQVIGTAEQFVQIRAEQPV